MAKENIWVEGKELVYRVEGKGEPLFLIHGYQADSSVWNRLIPLLKDHYQLFIPDLPGHGESPLIRPVNDMVFLAEILYHIVSEHGFEDITLAGHSMGGYVTLAYADRYPEMVRKLYLLNAHPFADTEHKKFTRKREVELIKKGKKQLLLTGFIKNNFAPVFRCNQSHEIQKFTELALHQPENGMLADIAGMMSRTDKTEVAGKLKVPIQVILGAEDINVPDHKFKEINDLFKVNIIGDCGHMCIIEKPEIIAEFMY